jgi:hypothetical protein
MDSAGFKPQSLVSAESQTVTGEIQQRSAILTAFHPHSKLSTAVMFKNGKAVTSHLRPSLQSIPSPGKFVLTVAIQSSMTISRPVNGRTGRTQAFSTAFHRYHRDGNPTSLHAAFSSRFLCFQAQRPSSLSRQICDILCLRGGAIVCIPWTVEILDRRGDCEDGGNIYELIFEPDSELLVIAGSPFSSCRGARSTFPAQSRPLGGGAAPRILRSMN